MTAESGPCVVTFGCRLNSYESERIRQALRAECIDDVIVVNTCAVTAEAERQARQKIHQLARRNPGARIVVTGCSATVHPEMYARLPGVVRVLPNAYKSNVALFTHPDRPIEALPVAPPQALFGFEGRARAFLQIQMGCNNYCSFCLIRVARGKAYSLPVEAILEQARGFVVQGFREINLTGVDICSFRSDDGGALGQLLLRLLDALPEDVFLRLSSLDPAAIDADMYTALQEPRVLPYWHLSIQSGDDLILRSMLRRHTAAMVKDVVARARAVRPETVLGSDLIVGFPGETAAMFAHTMELVEQCKIALLHVFPYSDRPGTVAEGLQPKVPQVEKKDRLQQLVACGARVLQGVAERCIGQEILCMVEKVEAGYALGKTDSFLPFLAPADGQTQSGRWRRVHFDGVSAQKGRTMLLGHFIEN